MVSLEAIVSGMGYAVLALLLGVLVSAGFLLPTGEPKELRQTLLRAGAYLVIVFLIIAVVSLLIQGAKLRQGTLPSYGRAGSLSHDDSKRQNLAPARSLRRSAGACNILVREKLGERKSNTLGFLARSPSCGKPQLYQSCRGCEREYYGRRGCRCCPSYSYWTLGRRPVDAFLDSLSWRKKNDSSFVLGGRDGTRFSRLALGSVAVLVLTGLYQSWIQVGNLRTLFGTDYGRVLLFKLVIFIAMLGFGALNFLSTGPRLLQAAQGNTTDLSWARKALRRIGAESFLALLVFFVTGLLTVLPPGVHAVHQAAVANGTPIAAAGGQPAAKLNPAEGASIEIISPKAEQVFKGDKVPLRFKLTKGKRGHHVHAYVDGELMGMFESRQGTLNGIRPGRHVLELRVVAEDHQTELDASDRITFVVK